MTTRDYAADLMATLHEFETQRQTARVVDAATDGEQSRHAALMAELGGAA